MTIKIFRESVKDSVERAKISLYGKEKDMFKFDMRVAQKTDRILQRLLIDGRVTKPPHPAEEVISKFTYIVYGAEKVRDCKNENMSDSIHWVDVCIRDLKNTIEMMRCFDSDLDYRCMEDIHETILNGYHMSKFYFLFFFDSYLVEGSDHNLIRERARFFIEDLNGVIERLRKQIELEERK